MRLDWNSTFVPKSAGYPRRIRCSSNYISDYTSSDRIDSNWIWFNRIESDFSQTSWINGFNRISRAFSSHYWSNWSNRTELKRSKWSWIVFSLTARVSTAGSIWTESEPSDLSLIEFSSFISMELFGKTDQIWLDWMSLRWIELELFTTIWIVYILPSCHFRVIHHVQSISIGSIRLIELCFNFVNFSLYHFMLLHFYLFIDLFIWLF